MHFCVIDMFNILISKWIIFFSIFYIHFTLWKFNKLLTIETLVFRNLKITFFQMSLAIDWKIQSLPGTMEELMFQGCPPEKYLLPIKITLIYPSDWGFPGGSVIKNPLINSGPTGDTDSILGLGRSPGSEISPGMATHSSILAWRIPWKEEPGRLQSMGLQRVGHDWETEHTHTLATTANVYFL